MIELLLKKRLKENKNKNKNNNKKFRKQNKHLIETLWNHRIDLDKHFPCSVREWNNSIYVFNKNNINLTPCSTLSALNIIKSYFNSFNRRLEKKIRKKRLSLRLRRLSSNKIYLSNGEFKHTNNNVLINLFIFNKQKYNYIFKLKKIKNLLIKKAKTNLNKHVTKILNSINLKGIQLLKKVKRDKYLFIKGLNTIENRKFKINTFKTLSKNTSFLYKKLLNKSLKKIKLYFILKQLIYINKSKLNYTYLQHVKSNLEKLYNKNVEFNIVNLKRFYLNSDILSEVVKLKITRNRKKLLKVLKKVKKKIKTNQKSFILVKKHRIKNIIKGNKLKTTVLDDLKYKHVTGFRLEAKGRLTKRHTASRSKYKFIFKGNLLNIDSSLRGLSDVTLRGNLKSNIQRTKKHSKTRIGSFGIKGWIGGN